MPNDSVDTEEPLKKNTQQQYNFRNSTISAENIIFGHGNNTDATGPVLRYTAFSCLLLSILSGIIIYGLPFKMNKEEFDNGIDKSSGSQEATDGISSSTAPEREQTDSWKSLKTYIRSNANTKFTAYYAGHKIDCDGSGHIRKFKLKWDCKCVDTLTRTPVKCKNYKSQGGACEHALAELVRTMNKDKIYPLPTDVVDMRNGC